MTLMWLAACHGTPFGNDAPYLISVNGSEPVRDEVSGPGLQYRWSACVCAEPTPGAEVPLELEVADPERDDVLVWFPGESSWVEFDPHGTSGVWHVPALEVDAGPLDLLLEDDVDPPARRLYSVSIDPAWCSSPCD